jgi:hypothetical protein
MSIDCAVKLLGPGSRFARPGHERAKSRRAKRTVGHGLKLTMSNSAVFFVPAARLCALVRLSCSPRPCPRLRCRSRRNLGGNPGSSNPIAPRTRGGWSADRRTLLLRRACEARPPCPGATGTPLGAPPWRFSAGDPRRQLRQWHRICAAACPLPGAKPGWTGSRAPRGAVRAAAAERHSSLRLKDRLRTTPLMSQDRNLIARIRSVVNSVVEM